MGIQRKKEDQRRAEDIEEPKTVFDEQYMQRRKKMREYRKGALATVRQEASRDYSRKYRDIENSRRPRLIILKEKIITEYNKKNRYHQRENNDNGKLTHKGTGT